MKTTWEEYQEAKLQILAADGVVEDSYMDAYGVIHKSWSSEKGGTFWECFNTNTGLVEYWSTKHSVSRYYQDPRYIIDHCADVFNAYASSTY